MATGGIPTTETERHDMIVGKLDTFAGDLADLKAGVTVLAGMVMRIDANEHGLPVKLMGLRQQLGSLEQRIDKLERAAEINESDRLGR